MKSFIILFLLMFMTTEVFAQRSTIPPRKKPAAGGDVEDEVTNPAASYDMYIPRPGANFLNLGISLLSSDTTVKSTSAGTKGSGYGLNLNYTHGLTTMFAYSISQDIYGYKYETSPNTGTSEISTLGPTLITLKGMKSYQGSFFYFSAAVANALLEKRDDQSGLNIFTENDRRNNFQLAGGFGALLGSFSLGGMYTHFMYQDTEVVYSNVTTKYKAGTGSRWKVYGQYEKKYKLGVSYGEEMIGGTDIATAGILIPNGYGEYNYSRIQGYVIIPMSNTTDFFGDITRIDRKNTSYYSKYDYYVGTASVRISF